MTQCSKSCRFSTTYTSAIDKQKEAIELNRQQVEALDAINERLALQREIERRKRAVAHATLTAREEAEKQHKLREAEIVKQHLDEVKKLNDTLIVTVDSLTNAMAEVKEQLAAPETLLPAFVTDNVEKLKDYFKITAEDGREVLMTYEQLDYIFKEKDDNLKDAMACLYAKLEDANKALNDNKKDIGAVIKSVTDLIKTNQINKAALENNIDNLALKLDDVETASANDIKNLTKLVNSTVTLLETLERRVSDLEK